MIRNQNEKTSSDDPNNFRSEEGAWAMEPEFPDPLEIRIRGLGDHCRARIVDPGTGESVEIDGDDLRTLLDIGVPLEECR